MKKSIATIKSNSKPKIICELLYKLTYNLGRRLYRVSEKCVYFSKLRDQKIKLDKEYQERHEVGEMVLDNEKIKEEILSTDAYEVSCEDTIKELGAQHIDSKNELQYCHETVYSLWEAYVRDDMEEMEKVFSQIGLDKKLYKGSNNEPITTQD